MKAYARAAALLISLLIAGLHTSSVLADPPEWSVARQWNEQLLHAIRNDFARPTVHARNLYHVSGAMWDAWAAYDPNSKAVIHHESRTSNDIQAAREEAISFAAYRLLLWRFSGSPGAAESVPGFHAKMDELGYDKNFTSTLGNTPAAVGNRIAQAYIDYGLSDHSNEAGGYKNLYYEPINEPLLPDLPGNPDIADPNRWQPLALQFFVDQGGNIIIGGFPEFLGPEWGSVKGFALTNEDLTIYERDGDEYWVYHDPGPPPHLGGVGDALYKSGFEQVVLWSGLLDPTDGVMIDISPASNGNNPLGTNDGTGYDVNPVTGLPYEPEIVPAGDYYRVLAEFWADGPDSETPPGHWFTIANYVSDHPMLVKKFRGSGPVLDNLEWDVKLYLTLGGTMHDVAISAWGVKGWYDYIRPISAIRYMCDRGQSSDPDGPSYHPEGISLYPGQIEVITEETAAPGGIHNAIAGNMGQHIGKIAVHAWRGPDYINDPDTETAGVDWIRCENWWPYQRPSFVTPPFAGYVSGHSTYSRAAAIIMSKFTGDEFFPGGIGTFEAPQNEFLVFEDGPSVDITLQWAKYADASDETSLSRIYGGIHPTADDIPGRFMGVEISKDGFRLAKQLFGLGVESNMATFAVSKVFDEGDNPAGVDVTLSCFTGLPLQQTQTITQDQGVNFVVTHFEEEELDCTVTEDESSAYGYTAEYLAAGPGPSDNEGGCNFFLVEDGAENSCQITNHTNPVQLNIEKNWLIDGSGGDSVDTRYKLTLYCDSEIVGGSESCPSFESASEDSLASGAVPLPYESCKVFSGHTDFIFIANVIPSWSGTSCQVIETVYEYGIEITNGCGSLSAEVGRGGSCTVTNTVFFEGIPTLGRNGLLALILLMMGLGAYWARRI